VGIFDGAAQQQGCGGGLLFHRLETHYFQISMGLGPGTNNHAKLISLQHLLYFSITKNCRNLQIFGDSKTVIDWFNNRTVYHAYSLKHILEEIVFFKTFFNQISVSHTYRERNGTADQLSKEATHRPLGEWMIIEFTLAGTYQYFHRPYIDEALQ